VLADLGVCQVPAPEAERHRGVRDRPPGEGGVQRRVAVRLQLEGRRAGLVPDMADFDLCVQCVGPPGDLSGDPVGRDAGRGARATSFREKYFSRLGLMRCGSEKPLPRGGHTAGVVTWLGCREKGFFRCPLIALKMTFQDDSRPHKRRVNLCRSLLQSRIIGFGNPCAIGKSSSTHCEGCVWRLFPMSSSK
jgi:hypothetical protein